MESDFYTIGLQGKSFTDYEEGIFTMTFMMSKDVVVHSRQIYNFLDLLGDIGGLSDALMIIGKLIVVSSTVISGNALDQFLVRNIFKRFAEEKIFSGPDSDI